MGRTTLTGPATGGILVIPLDNHKTTGSPVASNDFPPPFWSRILAISTFWNGVGATTQFEIFTGSVSAGAPGSNSRIAPHTLSATEMSTPDGLAHGAATAIPFVVGCSRDTSRLTQGGTPDEEGDEFSLGITVDGTVAALAYTIHAFLAVNSHGENPDNLTGLQSSTAAQNKRDFPYTFIGENQ